MVDFVLFRTASSERSGPVTALRRLISNWRKRRRLRRIGDLDDHILKDIGIKWHDVLWAIEQPLSVDPVRALEDRSRLRRKQALPDATRRWLQDAAYAHPRLDDVRNGPATES